MMLLVKKGLCSWVRLWFLFIYILGFYLKLFIIIMVTYFLLGDALFAFVGYIFFFLLVV